MRRWRVRMDARSAEERSSREPDAEPMEQPASEMPNCPEAIFGLASNRRFQNRYVVLSVCGLLAVAVALVFGQTLRHQFINYDDEEYVCKNRHVAGGLNVSGICWALTSCGYAGNW